MPWTCTICGRELVLEVLQNHSGWYLGYVCNTCGPQTRETIHWATREEAEDTSILFEETNNDHILFEEVRNDED